METIQTGIKQSDELSVLMGMTNISFTESQSTLTGPNAQVAASGAVSGISGQLHYRFLTLGRKAFYGQFTFPMMAAALGSYIAGGAGMEYYWGQTTAKAVLSDATTSFTVSPVWRYFAYGGINMGYLAYVTETAKKNDTLLEVELGGGLSKKFSSWTLRAQAGMARGVGVTTSTMGMKAMLGGIFFLD